VRLRGDVINPDYDFLDPGVERFFKEVDQALSLTGWIHGLEALSPQLKFAWDELAIMKRLLPSLPGLDDYHETLRGITQASNAVLFEVVEDLVRTCRDGDPPTVSRADLARESRAFVELLVRERDAFVLRNQTELLEALEPQPLAVA
jgi:hypothetical protein